MPNRLVRDGFLDSEAIERLGDASECFYHRLILSCDDCGRLDGRAETLRARLWPLRESLRVSDVAKRLQDCIDAGLLIAYQFNGKPYIQVTKWQRTTNTTASRYPWIDGSFKITFVVQETRDGTKEFVATSLSDAMPTPSACHPDGMPPPSSRAETETETETETYPECPPNAHAHETPAGVAHAHGCEGDTPVPDKVPTAMEIQEYADSLCFADFSGQEFFDEMMAQGWKYKGSVIVDWKALVRSFKVKRERFQAGKQDRSGQPPQRTPFRRADEKKDYSRGFKCKKA